MELIDCFSLERYSLGAVSTSDGTCDEPFTNV